jgi:hypothetical protein
MRFEVLTAKISMLVFWVVTPCGLVGEYESFGGTYCLHLQGWHLDPEMEAVCSSETLVPTFKSTRLYNPEDHRGHPSTELHQNYLNGFGDEKCERICHPCYAFTFMTFAQIELNLTQFYSLELGKQVNSEAVFSRQDDPLSAPVKLERPAVLCVLSFSCALYVHIL